MLMMLKNTLGIMIIPSAFNQRLADLITVLLTKVSRCLCSHHHLDPRKAHPADTIRTDERRLGVTG
jgi:hypothetical protein